MNHRQGIFIGLLLIGEISPKVIKTSIQDHSIYFSEWNLAPSYAGINQREKNNGGRSYQTPVTKDEKNCISYIVGMLGFESMVKIGMERSNLREAGRIINDVHPLNFLKTVFSSEEMKAGIIAICDRTSMIEKEFFSGIYGSLQAEFDRKNLLPYVRDFAKCLKVDESIVTSKIEENNWKELVNYLIKAIPRKTKPDRYDM